MKVFLTIFIVIIVLNSVLFIVTNDTLSITELTYVLSSSTTAEDIMDSFRAIEPIPQITEEWVVLDGFRVFLNEVTDTINSILNGIHYIMFFTVIIFENSFALLFRLFGTLG